MKVTEACGRYYVVAVNADSKKVFETGILAVSRKNADDYKYLDCILPDESLATVLRVIREVLGEGWTPYESFPLSGSQLERKMLEVREKTRNVAA